MKQAKLAKQAKLEISFKKLGYAKLFSRAGAKDLEVFIQFKIFQILRLKAVIN